VREKQKVRIGERMLEVDFFWTFAIGAMFAVAAARQLKEEKSMWVNKYFITLILFMAIFFGATGMVLLWNFPHWETMQVFWIHGDIPLWLILLWFVTNITNPIIAYYWSWHLIKKDQTYEAFLLSIAGYFVFFFVLIYGWDGTGWDRFLYDATITGIPWTPGSNLGLAWFVSNVAITLYILGVVFLTPHFYICGKWAVDGLRNDPALKSKVPEKGMKPYIMIIGGALIGVGMSFLMVLATAGIGWGLTAIGLQPPIIGGLIGTAIVIVPVYFFGLRRGMIFHKLFDKTFNMK
jgi:hypothetical protein